MSTVKRIEGFLSEAGKGMSVEMGAVLIKGAMDAEEISKFKKTIDAGGTIKLKGPSKKVVVTITFEKDSAKVTTADGKDGYLSSLTGFKLLKSAIEQLGAPHKSKKWKTYAVANDAFIFNAFPKGVMAYSMKTVGAPEELIDLTDDFV